MKDDIDDFVFVGDILGGNGHEFVDNLAEQVDITTRVMLDAMDQFVDPTLMLDVWVEQQEFVWLLNEITVRMSSSSMMSISWSRLAIRCWASG